MLDGILGERQRLARRDADLLGDEVEAGDLLGDAVLDLQPRVHLEEVELAVLEEHLDGAGVQVAARDRDLHRRLTHRAARRVGDGGRGRLFDQLLVPALRRAVAIAEVDGVAVRVAEDLELDVTRPRQVPLHVALGPPEVRLRLALCRLERAGGALGVGDHFHAAPAAAVRGLDRDRVAVLGTEVEDLLHVGDRLGGARYRRDLRFLRGDARRDLVAHDLDRFGRRTDPRDARGDQGAREVGVLREEPVPGMHAVGSRRAHRVEDGLGVEVALGRGLAAERVRLVGVADMLRVAVELRVHGDGRDAELAARPHDTDRDLTSVRDQDLREQCNP